MCRRDRNGEKESVSSILLWILSIAIVGACLVALVLCCVEYINSVRKFSNQTENALLIIEAEALHYDKAAIESLIDHMERMIAIQKNGMTNDLMSFVYGILSTLLVGLCAGFVVKSRDNADEAKKKVDEAKASAQDAKSHAESAANKAKKAEDAIKAAHRAEETVTESRYQLKLISILVMAKATKVTLLGENRAEINREFRKFCEEVKDLCSDDGFIHCKAVFGSTEMKRVYDEIISLGNWVYEFKERALKKENTDAGIKSIEASVMNYNKWIKEAIDCIENAGRKARAAEKAREG